MKIFDWLKGKKTYIVALGAIITALGAWLGDNLTTKEFIEACFGAAFGVSLRAGISKGPVLMIALIMILTGPGCARFRTKQTDTSTTDENGKPKRTIITEASAFTLFEAKSSLSQFKAAQTDKSQVASVGSLSQESNGTNVTLLVESIVKGVVSGLNPLK